MLLTPYRQEALAMLSAVPAGRKPFLRRSLRPDALLTTDLPRVAAEEDLAEFILRLEAQGWTALRQGELLELTPALRPPAPVEKVAWGGDRPALRRLHSLLSRHPAPGGGIAPLLAFLKAEEAGAQPLEALCQNLCRQCALCLRAHASLPGDLLPYVRYALAKEGKP